MGSNVAATTVRLLGAPQYQNLCAADFDLGRAGASHTIPSLSAVVPIAGLGSGRQDVRFIDACVNDAARGSVTPLEHCHTHKSCGARHACASCCTYTGGNAKPDEHGTRATASGNGQRRGRPRCHYSSLGVRTERQGTCARNTHTHTCTHPMLTIQ